MIAYFKTEENLPTFLHIEGETRKIALLEKSQVVTEIGYG
jgi:hypothetical protein